MFYASGGKVIWPKDWFGQWTFSCCHLIPLIDGTPCSMTTGIPMSSSSQSASQAVYCMRFEQSSWQGPVFFFYLISSSSSHLFKGNKWQVCMLSPLSLHFSERSINGIKILSLHIRIPKWGQSAHVEGQVCTHTPTSTCTGVALHSLYICACYRCWEGPWNLLSAPLKAGFSKEHSGIAVFI